MQLTIDRVFDKPKEIPAKDGKGPWAVVRLLFTERGEFGEVFTTPSAAPGVIETLTALKGQAADYEIEEKEVHGETILQVKSYPGKKQAGGGFGGGRQYTPRYTDTREGFVAEQLAIFASVSLKAAVDGMDDSEGKESTEKTLWRADDFFKWMCERSGIISDAPKPTQPPAAPPNPQRTPPAAKQHDPSTWAAPEDEYVEKETAQGEGYTEKVPNPRGKFFATWAELGLPKNDDYERYVIKRCLVKCGLWKEADLLDTRTQLSPREWGVAATDLPNYKKMLERANIEPMSEEAFVKNGVTA